MNMKLMEILQQQFQVNEIKFFQKEWLETITRQHTVLCFIQY